MTLDVSTGAPAHKLCPGASYVTKFYFGGAASRDALLTATLAAFATSTPGLEPGW